MLGHNHRLSLIGQALHAALVQSKVNDRFQEPMFIVLELLRSGVLHGQKFGEEYRSGGPVSGSEEEQASIMLIMRCLSILPLNFRVSDHLHTLFAINDPITDWTAAAPMGWSLVARTARLQLVPSCRLEIVSPPP